MSISLASDRGNTRKGGNSASLREPGHIANIRHKLGTKGIPHAAHSYDSGIFRELGSRGKVVMLVLRKQPICQEIVAKSTHFWLPS